jgi:NADPH-dependent 2,4-dienoyl-CoA reductase/sulfur reductase-like enzyme
MNGRRIRALDERGMEAVCEDYARSALDARRLGFDSVMLHFAHGWLPAQFLSPYFNRRTDSFGGSFENRVRFPAMIVNRVREALGRDYPVTIRIGLKEYVDGGLVAADVVRFLQLVEDQLDAVHVSSGLDKLLTPTTYVESPSVYPHQVNVGFARAAKQALAVPVVVAGGITLPQEAEDLLARGDADAVALGRALIADPDWPDKARRGAALAITPCLRCDSCYSVATGGFSQGCAVNPRYTRQLRLAVEARPASRAKRVAVVGGGPAGMKAAITAARRGHQVTLFEEEDRLGGLLRIADGDQLKQDMANLLTHLVAQIGDSKVEVRLGAEATPELLEELDAEELVLAAGSVPAVPPIPGIGLPHVLDIVQAHARLDALGRRVAIIGAGASGCEFALSLIESGRHVTLIEQSGEVAAEGNALYRAAIRALLAQAKGLRVLTGKRCVAIDDSGALVRAGSADERVGADSVVYATGMRPRRDLVESLFALVYDPKIIGDCAAPRRINEAIHEGYFAGLRI